MKKPPTPLEKLLSDKASLGEQCRRQEQKLGDTFACIHEHPGRLLLSLLSGVLLPASSKSAGRALLPVVWHIARPVLIAWGTAQIRSLLLRRLKRKTS